MVWPYLKKIYLTLIASEDKLRIIGVLSITNHRSAAVRGGPPPVSASVFYVRYILCESVVMDFIILPYVRIPNF